MKAILFGPFIGELFWEAFRFAPLLPYYKYKKYKSDNVKFIVLTREDRFDLYGKDADILVPLKINGDYKEYKPNCFRLDGFGEEKYLTIANVFKNKFQKHYDIIEHIFPDISKKQFTNKNQFSRFYMRFEYKPRDMNYQLIDRYIPEDKPIVVLAPRYRSGFRRNWTKWPEFYDKLAKDKVLMRNFNFVICGKRGEYVPDKKKRFFDINDIVLEPNASLVGLLLVLLERAILTFGSQSAIPNISLICGVEVLEFGCQEYLHTKVYNLKKTPVTFVEDKGYNIKVDDIHKLLKKILKRKKGEIKSAKQVDSR